MYTVDDITQSPNVLAKDYSQSHVGVRILLTGHSHQASPDCCLRGQIDAWAWTANHVEERWQGAFEKADLVRTGFAQLIHCEPERIALASSVHDFAVRLLSALPLGKKRTIISSDGEHPSVLRQLFRAQELGFDIITVPIEPAASVVERMKSRIDDKTAAVFVSSVFFETGHKVLGMETLMPVCLKYGAQLFVDAYQSVNVLPFSIRENNLEQAFVVGGGTKYCQLGDGIAFMHVPQGCKLRPWVTGWFGNFDALADDPARVPIVYGDDHALFDGSTYDPTAHFRAEMVFDYFREKALTPEFLHEINHHQLYYLHNKFRDFDFDPEIIDLAQDVEYCGGFLAFESPHARRLCEGMRDIGVHTDWRKNWLRMGPAPYLSDEQLEDGIQALDEIVRLIKK